MMVHFGEVIRKGMMAQLLEKIAGRKEVFDKVVQHEWFVEGSDNDGRIYLAASDIVHGRDCSDFVNARAHELEEKNYVVLVKLWAEHLYGVVLGAAK